MVKDKYESDNQRQSDRKQAYLKKTYIHHTLGRSRSIDILTENLNKIDLY